ncbi:MAG: hypothetical protein PHT60_15080 [Acidiphilium sp.]|nr:hypothetical protein [Acidiphilium sp.]MDD4937086.1 hypothetical protein [Acidiphilium sp.]
MNAITPSERDPAATQAQIALAQRLRGEAQHLVEDLKAKGVSEQDAAFTWISGIAASFVHLGGLLDYVGGELSGIVETQGESRAAFRKDVIEAARAQFAVIDAEIKKMQLAEAMLEEVLQKKTLETVNSLGAEILAANKSANVVFQKRWNLRQNIMGAILSGTLLLGCVFGGYLWRSYQEGSAVSGRYTCESAPLQVNSPAGSELACPLSDLVSPRVLAALNQRFNTIARPGPAAR